jgi:hypothetical protein
MAVIASGCIELPSKKILYKDSDVKVVKHKLVVIMADGGPTYFEFTGLGHNYKISAVYDYYPDSFARTPDGNAIVFLAGDFSLTKQTGLTVGKVHVVDLKSESYVTVPYALEWKGVFNPHVIVQSYDGKKAVLFLDSTNGVDLGGNLEVDLSAGEGTRFYRTNGSVLKPVSTP